MAANDYSPARWLDELHSALLTTRGKIKGKDVTLLEGLREFERGLLQTRSRNKAVWWIGNGGSNALCSHLSQDLLNKLNIRSFVFSDTALLTCMSNDFGYENVYARPLSTLAQPEDMLIAISSSGKSANILRSIELARHKKLFIVSVSAFREDNPMWKGIADVGFYLPTLKYGIAEVGHEALLHSAIETLWLRENLKG